MAGSLIRTSPVPCAPFSMLRTSGRRSPACARPSFCLLAGSLWEAGTDVPSAAEISAAFGPDVTRQSCLSDSAIALRRPFLSEIAAAGGFWCSAYHLSLFAILEAVRAGCEIPRHLSGVLLKGLHCHQSSVQPNMSRLVVICN